MQNKHIVEFQRHLGYDACQEDLDLAFREIRMARPQIASRIDTSDEQLIEHYLNKSENDTSKIMDQICQDHKAFYNKENVQKLLIFLHDLAYRIVVLLCVFWLCSKNPDPLSAPEKLYHKKENTVLTRENIERFIKHYSCTYKELRESPFGKQLLYSKPFVYTQRQKRYLSVSMFLVAMMLANSLYWLVRNYYLEKGKKENRNDQTFVNAFGRLFEDYIKDLASKYCATSEWRQLPAPSKKKGADFVFDFGSLQIIIESKSALLKLDAKQQVPNIESIDSFFDNTIRKSYKQLVSSYNDLRVATTTPIIKVILLYDEFSNTAIIEHSMAEIFDADSSCFVMTIRELEILLYLHCNDKETTQKILDQVLDGVSGNGLRKNIGSIYTELGIFDNPHLYGDMNYFAKLMENFKCNLE